MPQVQPTTGSRSPCSRPTCVGSGQSPEEPSLPLGATTTTARPSRYSPRQAFPPGRTRLRAQKEATAAVGGKFISCRTFATPLIGARMAMRPAVSHAHHALPSGRARPGPVAARSCRRRTTAPNRLSSELSPPDCRTRTDGGECGVVAATIQRAEPASIPESAPISRGGGAQAGRRSRDRQAAWRRFRARALGREGRA
jgi:hypothetical protein